MSRALDEQRESPRRRAHPERGSRTGAVETDEPFDGSPPSSSSQKRASAEEEARQMARGRNAERAALQETRAVYRLADQAYAAHSCPASGDCCQLTQTRREPWLWPSEWRILEQRVGRDRGTLPPPRADGGCPLLDSSGRRCTVYEDRPFGCRTFFCERRRGPSRQPAETVDALLRRLEAINQRLERDLDEPEQAEKASPRPLLERMERARRSAL